MGEHTNSIYKLTRQIKREDVGMYNCLCSITDDADFVHEICRYNVHRIKIMLVEMFWTSYGTVSYGILSSFTT